MSRKGLASTYPKSIVCLESLWNENLEERLSVLPILELTEKLCEDVDHIYLTCNTPEEFGYNVSMVKQRKRKGYQILVLAFHGSPGQLYLPNDTVIDLETLATAMGKGFKHWIVHFDSCQTIAMDEETLSWFMEQTGVLMLTGYRESVDWVEGGALDLLYFNTIQSYVDMHAWWRAFQKRHASLIEATGFSVFLGS